MGTPRASDIPLDALPFGRMVSGISEAASAASQEGDVASLNDSFEAGVMGVSIRFPSTCSKKGVTFDSATSPTSATNPTSGCLTVNRLSRKLSRQQSILRVPSCVGLGGKFMEDLKRSASSKAINVLQRKSSRMMLAKTSVDYEREIEELESQLEDASDQLLKACEVGQGLVQELEQTRTELSQVEESEMQYYDKMIEFEDAYNKLQEIYKRTQSEVIALKVSNVSATEEVNSLKSDVLRQASFNRRKEEESLIDRIENEKWISANLVSNNTANELQSTQSVCEQEEHCERNSVMETYFNILVDTFQDMHSSVSSLYNTSHKLSVSQFSNMTTLREGHVMQAARIEALESSAKSRKIEIEKLRGSLCSTEATAETTTKEHDQSTKKYSNMIKNASRLVSELREVCSVTKTALNESTRSSPGSPSGSAFSS